MGIAIGCTADLSGQVAIVTGCNTGIGLQTARMLCEAGAHVVMACRSPARAQTAKAEVTAKGGSAEVIGRAHRCRHVHTAHISVTSQEEGQMELLPTRVNAFVRASSEELTKRLRTRKHHPPLPRL